MNHCAYVLLVIITFSGMIAMEVLYGYQYTVEYVRKKERFVVVFQ